MPPTFDRLRPGQQPTAADWNALVEAVEQMGRVHAAARGGAVGLVGGPGGLQVHQGGEFSHWAKITARGAGNAYAHRQAAPRGDGTFYDFPASGSNGIWGTPTVLPAREVNGRTDLDADLPIYVKLWPDPSGPGFLFDAGGAAGGFGGGACAGCGWASALDPSCCVFAGVVLQPENSCLLNVTPGLGQRMFYDEEDGKWVSEYDLWACPKDPGCVNPTEDYIRFKFRWGGTNCTFGDKCPQADPSNPGIPVNVPLAVVFHTRVVGVWEYPSGGGLPPDVPLSCQTINIATSGLALFQGFTCCHGMDPGVTSPVHTGGLFGCGGVSVSCSGSLNVTCTGDGRWRLILEATEGLTSPPFEGPGLDCLMFCLCGLAVPFVEDHHYHAEFLSSSYTTDPFRIDWLIGRVFEEFIVSEGPIILRRICYEQVASLVVMECDQPDMPDPTTCPDYSTPVNLGRLRFWVADGRVRASLGDAELVFDCCVPNAAFFGGACPTTGYYSS